ncbi:MAG TPA: FtsX-like permease family protein, partial [Anaeromyxobacteraceae bacterium]|nr:FtsX-like permease family protein [Anaeromyxobacteraceae bacterium]
PVKAEVATDRLRAALGPEAAREELPALLQRLFAVDDASFDERYRIFYDRLAPLLRLYLIQVGDVITIKAPAKSGYFNSVNVKVYGFIQFRGIEKSGIAGMMSVLDLLSFRDLYGWLTKEKAEEIEAMKRQVGAREVGREEAEAALFGGAAPLEGEARQARIEEETLVRPQGRAGAPAADPSARGYSQDELERGVALNAALVLEDPRQVRSTRRAVQAAADAAGLHLKVIDWQEAAGLVGQFVTLLRVVLYSAVAIFFAVALVIVNNAMVLATLQRVKEIGTMRAIGAQRRFVLAMLLVETTTVGLVFGLAGAGLGGVAVWAVRAAGGIPATSDLLNFLFSGPALLPGLDTTSVVASLAVVVVVSVLSGIYPALIAIRVTPIEAIATED